MILCEDCVYEHDFAGCTVCLDRTKEMGGGFWHPGGCPHSLGGCDCGVPKIDALIKHKQNVIKYGLLFCNWLVAQGKMGYAKKLYLQLLEHDNSKFYGIQWEHLWKGEPLFEQAKKEHQRQNSHHPEFWELSPMSELSSMEMVVDWHSRMVEKGDKTMDSWLVEAKKRYRFSDKEWDNILRCVNLLAELAVMK